jgi:YidC/Oxa1 family membrane protein insertase
MDFISHAFGYLLEWMYRFANSNYGLALILFGIVVKLLLAPFTAKSKKSSMKMSRLAPRVKLLQEKYANDPQKQNQAIQELYKAEGVSMGGGCLWSLLPLLFLFPLFAVIREPITFMLHETATFTAGDSTISVAQGIVNAMKELAPDLFKGSNGYYDQIIAARYIPEYLTEIKAWLAQYGAEMLPATEAGINTLFLQIDLGMTPAWNFWTAEFWAGGWPVIGAALLPVGSAAVQLVSMLISMKLNNSVVTNEKGVRDEEAAKNSDANKTGKTMMYVGPIMSLLIGFGYPAALSIYWLIQGAVSTVIDVVLTLKYRKIYDAEDAERLQKYLDEQKVEEEKERVRAERRAANPDGITQNTSKKKVQQTKQAAREADRAAAARAYAEQKGEAIPEEPKKENAPLSGITDRPFAKGRAYDPNRYSRENTEE